MGAAALVTLFAASSCSDDGGGQDDAAAPTTTEVPAGPTVPPPSREATLELDELCALVDQGRASQILEEHGGDTYDGAGATVEPREATSSRAPVCRYIWHDDAGERFFLDLGEPTMDGLSSQEVYQELVASAESMDPDYVASIADLGDQAVLLGSSDGPDPTTGASFPSSALVQVDSLVLQASGLQGQRALFEPFLREAVSNLAR